MLKRGINVIEKIAKLKKEKNAVILAHFYQPNEIQAIADFVGDSLDLSRKAADCDADIIIFCGVHFMAGSAKILSPDKTVMIPEMNAGCPMADMVTAEDIKRLRKEHPDAAVVAYINSSVEVKAECDICCTSSNAIKIVNSLPNDEIIFVPDKNLGSYAQQFTDKKVNLFSGYCPVHNRITVADIEKARAAHPGVEILVHPECPEDVVAAADFVGSTAQIIDYSSNSDKKEFVIGTEYGVLYPLEKKNPDKKFYMLAENFTCANMKKTTLEDVLECLETGKNEIEIDEEIRRKASASLLRMLEVK
ncbi:MAG: quinolinate synthase NadA [Clostridia bacterium]|nr:quinolinate synthase NadA [Clostridia bacterium]